LAAPAPAAEIIRIGVGGAHTGDLASYGVPSLNAARLVAEAVNASGGILGMQVEIVPQDDQCKPEMGTNAATKLVSDKVNAVMGHICSGPTKAVLPIYTEARLVVISPSSTSPELTDGKAPYFFRTIARDDQQAHLGAAYALDKLGVKKIALIHDKGDYGKGYIDYAKAYIEGSGKAQIVLYEGITVGAVDYSAILQKLRQSGADLVMFGGYHPEASKLVQQMRKKRINTPFLSDDGVKDEQFIKVTGKDAEGVFASGSKDVTSLAMNRAARAAHVKKFGSEPGNFFDNGYAATLALLKAMEKAGTATDSDKIAAALRADLVDTPLGSIKFGPSGDAEGIGFDIYIVKNGKFVVAD
jgi:branched-chain amino acid transport system substrate-binding protein